MKIIFLGTSGGIPTSTRSLPAVAVLRDGEMMLFDCGEGTQVRIMKKGIGFGRLSKIFISHIHGDHLSGLMGLLMTMSLLEHTSPIDIWGPSELEGFFDAMERYVKLRCRFPVTLHTVKRGVLVREEDYIVEAFPTVHSTPGYAFAIQERVRPGRFDLDKARAMGLPEGPLFGQVQRGETVTLDDGRTIGPADLLGPPRPGRRVVYATDTLPLPDMVSFARGADLLIHEGMFAMDMQTEADERKHCTAAAAARIAAEAHVRRLVLTHISPRYRKTDELRDEARQEFPEAVVASDLMELEIPLCDEVVE
jgi:ribonuclease Z